MLEIPASNPIITSSDIQGRIIIEFITGSWDADLGTGKASGSSIPCKHITGILPIQGKNSLECIQYSTYLGAFPTILIKGF